MLKGNLHPEAREALGKLVRKARIEYCEETGDTKLSHIAPWAEIGEWDKEADRRIGEVIWQVAVDAMRYSIDKIRESRVHEGPAPSIRRGSPRDSDEAPPSG